MKRLVLIVLSIFFLTTPALAKDNKGDMWIVSQQSGDTRVVHRGIQRASLTVNLALAPGDVVITGAGGRATLARGSDYIVIAPHSELRLPASTQASRFTRVVQQLGTMLFKVKHTGVPHFAVDTPMLAAVVKGTTFTVIVERDRSAVQVTEGVVQVTAADGGMQRFVEGGATVFIDRNNPKQLITADARSLGAPETSSETSVKITGSEGEPLSNIAELTGGLVQADPIVRAANTSPVVVAAVVASTAPAADTGTSVQPIPGSTAEPILAPIADTVVTPVVGTVAPIANTVVTPVVGTVAPVANSVVTPVVGTVAPPVVNTVVTPIVNTVVAPVVAPVVNTVVAPIVNTVVAPIVTPIVNTVVAPVVAPVVNTVVAPIVVTPIVEHGRGADRSADRGPNRRAGRGTNHRSFIGAARRTRELIGANIFRFGEYS